jgi:8-oxo-dGTP pyrophosphatase MutT (NUDIX family)
VKPIRVSAKAVIIRDGKLLATKNVGITGVFYLLPGGAQMPGEALDKAVRRECREEVGVGDQAAAGGGDEHRGLYLGDVN